ncbi:MAG TPA: hypothetical protein PK867_32040, partial [Pirellulales bacterium]|nr:hypothetical protein [Pirellulales bacterium]
VFAISSVTLADEPPANPGLAARLLEVFGREAAAAKSHLRRLQQRELQAAFNARINKNVDRLRGPLAMELRL